MTAGRRHRLAGIRQQGGWREMHDWIAGLDHDSAIQCVAVALAAAESVLGIWSRARPDSDHAQRGVRVVRACLASRSELDASTAIGLYDGDKPTGLEGYRTLPVVDGVALDERTEAA